jgi:hypothetical protein
MAIAVECESCHAVAEVPDAAAAQQGKCRKCGAAILVPNRRPKVCIECGIDVSSTRRVKDVSGQYRCQACYDGRLAAAQQRQAEIEVVAAEFNEIKRARRNGNITIVCVWTPLVLFLICREILADRPAAEFMGYTLTLLVSYVFPLVVLSLAWPAFRQSPAKLGRRLQDLVDGKAVEPGPVPALSGRAAESARVTATTLFVVFLIEAALEAAGFAGVDLSYRGQWWQVLPLFGGIAMFIGMLVAAFYVPLNWSTIMRSRQPFKAMALVGGFGLIAGLAQIAVLKWLR